ncbi:hypothetical protein KTF24_13930 [Burkholderia multivorans]|uniref:hypothetical protein n=1 Tax=Burkholderia multivorans TaxID=87883 RepID=UPI001C246CA3|nr:hypothetical protein [Burkholderia multivorans]MBU9668878.1 hypothetical protein [Burkholderia multivorans]HEF4754614.1 hypothetical protein [Burkholderia multivorans]
MQIEIPVFQAVKEPDWVAEYLIGRLRNEHDAVLLCWNKRRVKYSMSDAAALLGLPKSHLSNILAGKKYLPYDMRVRFQQFCGNYAIRQYEDKVFGFKTIAETPQERELRELRAKVAALEAAA